MRSARFFMLIALMMGLSAKSLGLKALKRAATGSSIPLMEQRISYVVFQHGQLLLD